MSGQEKGFSLLEAMVSQVIMILVALAVLSAFIVGAQLNAESEDKTIAANIAQKKMEEITEAFKASETIPTAGIKYFEQESRTEPYYTRDPAGTWRESLSNGRYEISYPDGSGANPLRVKVKVVWSSPVHSNTSLELVSLASK